VHQRDVTSGDASVAGAPHDEAAEIAAAFAEADAALAEHGPVADGRAHWLRLREPLARALERAVVHAWHTWFMLTPRGAHATRLTGGCELGTCTASRVRLRLFATDARYLNDPVVLASDYESPDGRSLHACTPFCVRTTDRALHHRDITQAAVDGGFSVLAGMGRVYWCDRHAKAHICDGACSEGALDERGLERCALSRRELAVRLEAAYGDGSRDALRNDGLGGDGRFGDAAPLFTTRSSRRARAGRRAANANVFHERLRAEDAIELFALEPPVASKRALTLAESVPPASKRARTPAPSGALEAMASEPVVAAAAPSASATVVPPPPPSTVAMYVDDPRVRLFSDFAHTNTFADGVGHAMVVVYGQCHAAVALSLFSNERAAIEARRASDIAYGVESALTALYAEARARNAWITLDEVRRRRALEIGNRRVPPHLKLPVGAVDRLCAYYAMLALEFFWGIRPLAYAVEGTCATLLARLPAATGTAKPSRRSTQAASRRAELNTYREVAARVTKYTAANATPSILSLVRRGFRELLLTMYEPDAVLQVLAPDAAVLQELYLAERTSTLIMRDLKQTVAAARDLGFALDGLRGTQLSLVRVMYARGSVCDLFLRERLANRALGR